MKEIRLKKNIKIEILSQETGISLGYISDLENNKKFNPTLDVLHKIANYLEVNIKDLFYSEADIEPLKELMYEAMDKHGNTSEEALSYSKIIDELIIIKMTGNP